MRALAISFAALLTAGGQAWAAGAHVAPAAQDVAAQLGGAGQQDPAQGSLVAILDLPLGVASKLPSPAQSRYVAVYPVGTGGALEDTATHSYVSSITSENAHTVAVGSSTYTVGLVSHISVAAIAKGSGKAPGSVVVDVTFDYAALTEMRNKTLNGYTLLLPTTNEVSSEQKIVMNYGQRVAVPMIFDGKSYGTYTLELGHA